MSLVLNLPPKIPARHHSHSQMDWEKLSPSLTFPWHRAQALPSPLGAQNVLRAKE